MKEYLRPAALVWILFSLLLSCKTPPPAEDIPARNGETGEEAPLAGIEPIRGGEAAEAGPPVLPDDEVSVFLPPGEVFVDAAVPLIEPVLDTPETDSPLLPPPEAALSALLPEPLPPDISPPPESAPEWTPLAGSPSPPSSPEEASPPSSVPPSAVSGGEAAPVSEAPPAPPPEPPRFLRPAEQEPPPAISREPVPVPVNPPPELPAGVPPRISDGEEIEYSRIVRATAGQLVEIPFRGTGWVYLGELASRQGISYDSRRLDPEGQSFIFRTEKAGTYGLKFYKQDFIRDYILNDHVQVIVGEAPAISGTGWFNPPLDRGRVIAEPRWPAPPDTGPAPGTAVPAGTEPGTEPPRPGSGPVLAGTAAPESPVPGPALPGAVPGESPAPAGGIAAVSPEPGREEPASPPAPARPVISDDGIVAVAPPAVVSQAAASSAVVPPQVSGALSPNTGGNTGGDTSPGGYLRRAREEFNAGRIGSALSVLDQFREGYPSGSDEAWWLYGQLFEASGPNRDIRSALDYYRRLTREYPQSPRYADARRRIAYLERYYFNIP